MALSVYQRVVEEVRFAMFLDLSLSKTQRDCPFVERVWIFPCDGNHLAQPQMSGTVETVPTIFMPAKERFHLDRNWSEIRHEI